MVVLEAYFDESGHPADCSLKVFSIAGFIAPCNIWKRWELDWLYALSKFGIRPEEFHMKDYAHSNGAFSGWKGQEGQRRQFLADLLHAFNPLFVPIGSSVILEHYRNLSDRHKEIIGNEYELCFKHLLLECVAEVSHCPEGEEVSLVFEEQKEFSGHAHQAYGDFRASNPDLAARIHSVTWTPKKEKFLPLLAADLLAYEMREHIEELHYKEESKRRKRYPAQWILRWLTTAGGVFGKPEFERLVLKLDEAAQAGTF
jgi:hypothetical protein